MLCSYHVHSRWSDGKAEMIDYVRAAEEIGLNELGFSDHYVPTPDGHQEYFGMPLGKLDEYVEAVQEVSGEAGEDLIIRLGIEFDYFPETQDQIRDLIESQPFDYVIGSVHFVNNFPIDDAVEPWEKLTQPERDDEIRGYWERLRQMAESGLFDIAGHLDLTKKFGFEASVDVTDDVLAALDAIARAGMAFEVNTSGWFKPCKEVYPAPWIVKACYDRHIPVLVTADAHYPKDLVQGYEEGFDLIQEIGYTEIATYSGRHRYMAEL